MSEKELIELGFVEGGLGFFNYEISHSYDDMVTLVYNVKSNSSWMDAIDLNENTSIELKGVKTPQDFKTLINLITG